MKNMDIKGVSVPKLGFGTWQVEGDVCVKAVEKALSVGYRHVDTAQIYGNEAEVGTALQNSGVNRDEIFLTTKVWRDQLAPQDVHTSTEESLKKLKTDYVDLLLIHWPVEEVPLEDTLRAMDALKMEGKVRNFGLSNFPVNLMRKAVEELGADIFANQVEYHPFLSQKPVLDYAREHDLMLTAYSPLVRGDATENATLTEIGNAHGKNAPQVALRWLIQQDNVSAIPRSGNPDHIASNFDIFDFELSDEEMAKITGLNQGLRTVNPDFAPRWDAA